MKVKYLYSIIALFALVSISCTEEEEPVVVPEVEETVFSTSHTGEFDGEYGAAGEMTVNCDYNDGELNITQLVVKYDIGYFLGEVTWKAIYKWEGKGGIYQLLWAAQVLDANGVPVQHNGEIVYCSIYGGTYPDPGEGFGVDVTASPYWDKVFKYYDEENKELINAINEEDAKAIYKADFVLGNIKLIEINEKKL